MARTMAGLPDGTRVTDHISLGLVTKAFPLPLIRRILSDTARTSQRERELPAPVMVYYVIALALYMQVSYREVLRCLLEGLRWLAGPDATIHAASPSGISQARTRLGAAPVRRLYEEVHPAPDQPIVAGDGLVPVASALLPGARHLVLDDAVHGPGVHAPWYGQEAQLNAWWPVALEVWRDALRARQALRTR